MADRRTKIAMVGRLAAGHAWRLAGILLLTVALSLLAMLPPLVVRGIIDRVLIDGDSSLLVGLGACMLLIPLLAAVCRYAQTVSIAFVGQRPVFDMRVELYDHLLGLSLRFFGKHSVGKLVNRLMGDSNVVHRMLTSHTVSVLSDMVCAGFAITVTFAISWRLAILLVVIVTGFVANYRYSIRKIRTATRGYQGALDRLSGGVQNRLAGSLTVKTFGMEEREQRMFRGTLWEGVGLSQSAMIASNTFSMNIQLIQSLGWAVLYFLGCGLVLRGEMSYGDVIAFTTFAMQLLGPAVNFSELARQLQDVNIAVDRLAELFEEKAEVRDRPGAMEAPRLRGQVDFEHVSFQYVTGVPVLRDFDLHVRPGESVALIGPTGCGKSTILSLLTRFYDACGGRLLLDGKDVREISLRSLRRQFGIVLQEPLLFNGAIADNIRYSRARATQAEIEDAARIAEIHDFILSLPDGYRTEIGGEGTDLSLGQKQRITIARAVVADPAILIMDEATSALDSESERAIQIAMKRVLAGRTSFIVAHRLSTIRNADRIILLKDGRIEETGAHDELMRMPEGKYRHLYLAHIGTGILNESASS